MAGLIASVSGIHDVLTTHLPAEVHVMSGRARRKFAVQVSRLFLSPYVSFIRLTKEDHSFCRVKTARDEGVLWICGVVHSSINLAQLPRIQLVYKSYIFSLPGFLTTIYISLCSKIIFNCNYSFISAKYFVYKIY